jgi:hypothetical protein
VTRTTRARRAGLAAALITLPLLAPGIASANGGGWDHDQDPPAPSECAGFLWTQDVHAEGAQKLSKDNPWIKIEGLTIPAGVVHVTEAITWDDRSGWWREQFQDLGQDVQAEGFDWSKFLPIERYEKMRVDFWSNDDYTASTPEHTGDLADDTLFPSVTADLGSAVLTQGSDAVYLKHASMFMDTDDRQNDFFPASVCITWDPYTAAPAAAFSADCSAAELTLTNDGDLAADLDVTVNGVTETVAVDPAATVVKNVALTEDSSTTFKVTNGDEVLLEKSVHTDCVAPAVVVTTTPPTTAPPAIVPVETVVLDETVTAPELAFTGSDTAAKTGIGVALLGLGAALIGFGRKRRHAEA